MPEDINELDATDAGLKAIMGDRFHDETKPAMARPKKISTNTCKETNLAQKPTEKPVDAQWQPIKEHTWMDSLKNCVQWVIGFGGLSLLLWYWEQAGLMAESIAVPSMCLCTALAGWGLGKNVAGGK